MLCQSWHVHDLGVGEGPEGHVLRPRGHDPTHLTWEAPCRGGEVVHGHAAAGVHGVHVGEGGLEGRGLQVGDWGLDEAIGGGGHQTVLRVVELAGGAEGTPALAQVVDAALLIWAERVACGRRIGGMEGEEIHGS